MTTHHVANPRLGAMAALVIACLAAPMAAAAEVAPPTDAVPLTAPELLQIYGDKTWQWATGGGYFQNEGRAFLGYSVNDKGVATTARGTWRITDRGQLCFAANWITDGASYPANTCFLHVAAAGEIYQKKLPDGRWYVFRHAKPQAEDEYAKLVKKDLVSAALQQTKQSASGQ